MYRRRRAPARAEESGEFLVELQVLSDTDLWFSEFYDSTGTNESLLEYGIDCLRETVLKLVLYFGRALLA